MNWMSVTKERDQQAMMQWRLSQYYKEMKEHFIVHLVKEELERESPIRERAKWFQLDTWEDAMFASLQPVSWNVMTYASNRTFAG